MGLKYTDRTRDVTTTTGTGNITLSASPPLGFRAFSTALATGDKFYYAIQGQGTGEWETGIGTMLSSTVVSRIFLASSTGALVSFAAGTKDIWVDIAGGSGTPPGMQFYRLNAALVGSNATGAQSLFGKSVTLDASTVYAFEISYALLKSVGTTSHQISIGFGGTATLNNIGYSIHNPSSPTGPGSTPPVTSNYTIVATATNTTVALTAASIEATGMIFGTVSVNVGGTFIPQYTLSVAPGGAYSTDIGAYMSITPLGPSGADSNIGTWA